MAGRYHATLRGTRKPALAAICAIGVTWGIVYPALRVIAVPKSMHAAWKKSQKLHMNGMKPFYSALAFIPGQNNRR